MTSFKLFFNPSKINKISLGGLERPKGRFFSFPLLMMEASLSFVVINKVVHNMYNIYMTTYEVKLMWSYFDSSNEIPYYSREKDKNHFLDPSSTSWPKVEH